MTTQSTIEPIKVLLIEDNPGDARLARERLLSAPRARFEVESADRLAGAIERLHHGGIDVVLLDLSLPDSQGIETIISLHAEAPEIPIIALSGLDDQEVIEDAVKHGAEDYLVKGAFSTDILVRTIRYAIDRRKLREELARARDAALESAHLRSEFLANMSHEIRTPLNGVVGVTRLLMDTLVNTEQREMLEIAHLSADALLKIVNEILDFSKIAAGKVVLEEADFDLGAAVGNVVQIFSEQAHAKGVVLDLFIDADVPTRLRGDSGRLSQVLINLIGNAIKFTPGGDATVRVERIGGGDDNSILRFQVRDTGIGIAIDAQRYLFRAFVQADSSTTRRFGGTGLGLAISAQLVELMGGTIGLESEPGHGSTFWFTARFPHHPGAAPASDADHLQLERVRVLVVDDNANSARVMSDRLQAWRMRPEIAINTAQALASLRQALAVGDPFQIAIIDLATSDQDGLDLAHAIKDIAELAAIRVLGIYAIGERPQASLTVGAGIRAVLSKPVRQSQLFDTLNALMAGSVDLLPELPRRERLAREMKSTIPAEIRERTHILLVEDNLVNQQVEMRMIDRIGYHAEPADNGRLALERLEHTHDFDIILMDCQMPEVDGYSATREIRRREGSTRHTPIIGVTARALPEDRDECLRAGMDDYIAKPVMPEDLAAIIDKWVAIIQLPPVAKMTDADAQGARPEATSSLATAVLDERVLAELREYQNPGEPDFVTELIGVFEKDLANRLVQMRAGLEAGDANRVRQAAHALKGASGELGAQRMREICARLELGTAEGSIASASPLVRELEDEAVHVRGALAAHCVEAPLPRPVSGL